MAKFKTGGRGWLTINEGKFYAEYPFGGEPNPETITTKDPEKVRKFFIHWDVDHVSCSSSVDFPEEYGMSKEQVSKVFMA